MAQLSFRLSKRRKEAEDTPDDVDADAVRACGIHSLITLHSQAELARLSEQVHVC